MGATLDVVPVTTADYRRRAERFLPRFLFDYVDGGANDETTMAANAGDLQRLRIRQRVLVDVSGVDAQTTVAGTRAALPLVLAPVGMAGMMARRGEVLAARAAQQGGVPFTLSTLGVCTLDEIRAATSVPFWFQLYMLRDRGAVRGLLEKAAAAGCTTLVFTVDLPVIGMRHRDARNGMLSNSVRGRLAKARQIVARPRWVLDVALRGKPHTIGNLGQFVRDPTDLAAYKAWIDSQFDPGVTWRDIEWLRGAWRGRLLLKGVQEVEDARAAVAAGADGVIVSNHGGRQLDSVASAVSKLPPIVDAIGDRAEVLLDGGVRNGLDVLKAVALGARAATIGRPWVYAVAAGGTPALADLLGTFRRELEVGMALAGVTRVADLRRDHLEPSG